MSRLKLAILASGAGTTMEAIAAASASGQVAAEIPLVASDRPDCGALAKAQARNIPTLVVRPQSASPSEWEALLARHLVASGAELVVLAGFLRILKGPVLDAFPGRIINLHPALLPKFGGPGMYGTRVHAAVLASGESLTGSTVHLVTRDVDGGPIIAQKTLEVRKGETAEELSSRQRPLEHELMVDTIGKFATGEFPLPWSAGPTTYAKSGVNTEEIKSALGALVRQLTYAPPAKRGKALGGMGHFAGLVRLEGRTFALTTDGVGTKVLIAEELGRWEEVGEDMVAVNVNDLTAAGAQPVALVDHIMLRRPEARVLSAIGRGLNRGISKAGCTLLGGETAMVPELLSADYDLSATALGYFPRGWSPVTGSGLRPGDVLIGLASSGIHSNGYTLVRRLLREHRISLDEKIPGEKQTLGRALLSPTQIYAPWVEPLLSRGLPVALSHITGGAFRKNLIRLNPRVRFVLDGLPVPRGLFAWISETSRLSPEELYKTFNMGIGFVVAVRARDSDATLKLLRVAKGSGARVIGHVERGAGVSIPPLGVDYPSW